MSTEYPKDEFDLAGEDMPVGIHRPVPSRWRAVWPFLLLLVVVPLLGWGASHLLVKDDSSDEVAQSVLSAQSGEESGAQSGERSGVDVAQSDAAQSVREQDSAPAPQPAAEPEPQVKHDVAISVLNGKGVPGLAAEKAGVLGGVGFTNTSTGNANEWQTQVATVFYNGDDLADTAKAVGEALEITEVRSETQAVQPGQIVVILR